MSRRPAVSEKMLVSMCDGVGVDATGAGSVWSGLVRVVEGKGRELRLGLPSKITMVVMTFSAFLIEKHVA